MKWAGEEEERERGGEFEISPECARMTSSGFVTANNERQDIEHYVRIVPMSCLHLQTCNYLHIGRVATKRLFLEKPLSSNGC